MSYSPRSAPRSFLRFLLPAGAVAAAMLFAPETPIADIFARHGDHPDIRNFVETAAMGIATAVNIIDPELVFLGGGVLEMPAFPLETLKARLLVHTRAPLPRDVMEVRLASNLGDSGARGASLYVARQFGAQP